MDHKKVLAELQKFMPNHPHVFFSDKFSLNDWIKQGKPHVWKVLETYRDCTFLEDMKYGPKVLLLKGNKVADFGPEAELPEDGIIGLSEHITPNPGLFKRVSFLKSKESLKKLLVEKIAQEIDSPKYYLHLGFDQVGELSLNLAEIVLQTLEEEGER